MEMIEKADQDHDGLVSEEEFYNIMTRKIANVWWLSQIYSKSYFKLRYLFMDHDQ